MHPQTIGSFQIIRELGRGGMGEVFLARDTRLDRQVAIKSLPAHLASDPDRLARFQREAKILASLNHSGIGAIYGLEEAGGQQYLVLEYIEGETLADLIKRGAIPVDEALAFAKQIAEALEVAHEKGIIHRDLKPGNVMVTPDGAVKVLDFGLARTDESPPSSISQQGRNDSPTLTSPLRVNSPTIPGVILGTAGYMSPEQARGKAIDKRSDIFSFGCVLYEMLSGSMPFPGETVTDSLGAILHREPDWERMPKDAPPRIRELLERCLAKDRKQRLHDIGDARLELDLAIAGHEWKTSVAHVRPVNKLKLAMLCAIAAIALPGLGWAMAIFLAPSTQHAPTAAKLSIPSRTPAYFWGSNPAISPDGKTVAFMARPAGALDVCLWLRPIDSFEAKPLPETAKASNYFWSADSRSIAFHSDGKLWSVDVVHGGSRRLIAAEPGNVGASWGPDGTILLARFTDGEGGIIKIPPGGGKIEQATSIDAKAFESIHCWPHFLPDGKHFLFVVIDRKPDQDVNFGHLYAGRLDSTERTFIANITSQAAYVDPGWLVYVEDGTIKAAPFDDRSLRITGEATMIADDVSYFRPVGSSNFSSSKNGSMVFVPPIEDQQLVWFDAAGTRLGNLAPRGNFDEPRISPDGTRVVVSVSDRRTGLSDLWIYGVDRPTTTHLTTDAGWEGSPVWSKDGSMVYFSSDKKDLVDIYSIRADGSGDIRPVYGPGSGGRIWFARSISPDGKSLIVSGQVDKLDRDLRVISLDGSSAAVPLRSSPATESSASISPDGRWLVFASNESSRSEVYLAAYPGNGPKVQISEGGYAPVWSPSGDEIYYIQSKSGEKASSDPSRIMAVDLKDPASFASPQKARVLLETAEEIASFDVTPDGKKFLVGLSQVENPPMQVILNGMPSRR